MQKEINAKTMSTHFADNKEEYEQLVDIFLNLNGKLSKYFAFPSEC